MPCGKKKGYKKKRTYKGRPIWEAGADLSFKDFDIAMKKMGKSMGLK